MDENEVIQDESVEIMEVNSLSVIEAQDRAVVDMQIATAKKYPRNVRRAVDNSLAIVTMDMETAKCCGYALPRGGKVISGPSVHMAKILAQNWGNLRVETKVINIEERFVTSQAIAFDLETNVAIKVEAKRSIFGKNTGRYSDDMIVLTSLATNSIALRNAVFAVIPKSVVDRCYSAAKQKITGDLSDNVKLIARRKQVIDALKDTYSVTEREILSSIGKQSLDHINADDLVILIGVGQAIKDGDTTVEQAFKGFNTSAAKIAFDDVEKAFKLKKDLLDEGELKNALRILEKKEEKSYSKLFKLLQGK